MPAIDMLLFLANNPEHDTAKDICKLRGFKPAIVSFHVDKMVEEGYLERKTDEHDRRKFCLAYTDKATDIIERGREIQLLFAKKMLDGISDGGRKKRCNGALTRFQRTLKTYWRTGSEERAKR